MSTTNMMFTDARARSELGYSSRPASEAMADAARWFAEHGYVTPKRLGLMRIDADRHLDGASPNTSDATAIPQPLQWRWRAVAEVLAIEPWGSFQDDSRGGGVDACMLLVLEAYGPLQRVHFCSATPPPLRSHRDAIGRQQGWVLPRGGPHHDESLATFAGRFVPPPHGLCDLLDRRIGLDHQQSSRGCNREHSARRPFPRGPQHQRGLPSRFDGQSGFFSALEYSGHLGRPGGFWPSVRGVLPRSRLVRRRWEFHVEHRQRHFGGIVERDCVVHPTHSNPTGLYQQQTRWGLVFGVGRLYGCRRCHQSYRQLRGAHRSLEWNLLDGAESDRPEGRSGFRLIQWRLLHLTIRVHGRRQLRHDKRHGHAR